jgi:hypothetical protein
MRRRLVYYKAGLRQHCAILLTHWVQKHFQHAARAQCCTDNVRDGLRRTNISKLGCTTSLALGVSICGYGWGQRGGRGGDQGTEPPELEPGKGSIRVQLTDRRQSPPMQERGEWGGGGEGGGSLKTITGICMVA